MVAPKTHGCGIEYVEVGEPPARPYRDTDSADSDGSQPSAGRQDRNSEGSDDEAQALFPRAQPAPLTGIAHAALKQQARPLQRRRHAKLQAPSRSPPSR